MSKGKSPAEYPPPPPPPKEGGNPPPPKEGGNPPRPPQPPTVQWPNRCVLHMRGQDALEDTIRVEEDMVTICPTSMEWLVYLKALAYSPQEEFHFTTDIYDHAVPHLEFGEETYYTLTEFSNTQFSLELREKPEPLEEPKTLEEAEKREREKEMETQLLEQAGKKKSRVVELLSHLQMVCSYGIYSLSKPNTEWTSASVATIQGKLGITNDGVLEDRLKETMKAVCGEITEQLGNHTYFLDGLKDQFGYKSLSRTMTMIDAMLAASIILIKRYFHTGNDIQQTYTNEIHSILKRHIQLWAQADLIYIWLLREARIPRNYTEELEHSPQWLVDVLRSGPQAIGGQGLVYKVHLGVNNVWQLDEGYYAFKVSRGGAFDYSITGEIGALQMLPYSNIIKLLGMGSVSLRREDLVGITNVLFHSKDSVKEVVFLVTDWFVGGDLAGRIEDFSLSQITKILEGIIYGLYVVYRTGRACIADLKPPNVLLDQNDNPHLCDFGSLRTEGQDVASDGTSPYNDSSQTASHKRDVFAYGVILFELLTDEVDRHAFGYNFALKIQDYQNQGIDLVEYVKPRLKSCPDYDEQKARELLYLGARCIKLDYEERASALEIINKLNERNDLDVVDL